MPRVLNKKHGLIPLSAVYVGRPSKWGNPFRVGAYGTLDGTREEVIEKYRKWITEGAGHFLLRDLHELRGKDLVCHCAPLPCHADVLLELANR